MAPDGAHGTRATCRTASGVPKGLTIDCLGRRLPFVNAYRDAVDPLDALGDATRRAIVEGLRDGERTVGDLATGLPVSRPAVSQHLGVLKSAGLVLERAAGTRHYYRLDPIGLTRLQNRLDAMWGAEPGPIEAPLAAIPPAAPAALEPAGRAVKAKARAEEPEAAPAASAAGEPVAKRKKKGKKKGGRK
jgi:DNA-binding transcriptional ArsR family regulator